MLRCGQNRIRIRPARGGYKKESRTLNTLSCFVVPDQNMVCPRQLQIGKRLGQMLALQVLINELKQLLFFIRELIPLVAVGQQQPP